MFKFRFKIIKFALISYITILLQASLVNIIKIGRVKPDLILFLVVFFSLYNGQGKGFYSGLIIGFCVDLLSAGILGVNCFLYGTVGWLAGFAKDRVYPTHLLTKFLLLFLGSVYSIIAYYIIAINFFRLPAILDNILTLCGSVLYTVLINMFLFSFLERYVVTRVSVLE